MAICDFLLAVVSVHSPNEQMVHNATELYPMPPSPQMPALRAFRAVEYAVFNFARMSPRPMKFSSRVKGNTWNRFWRPPNSSGGRTRPDFTASGQHPAKEVPHCAGLEAAWITFSFLTDVLHAGYNVQVVLGLCAGVAADRPVVAAIHRQKRFARNVQAASIAIDDL